MERYQIRRGLNRLILLPIFLSVAYAGLVLWQLNRMLSEGAWVEHTTQVISLSNQVQKHIASQEAALRGYLLIHSPKLAEQFVFEDHTVDTTFQLLHQQVLDNSVQTLRLDSVLQVYWSWQAAARRKLLAPSTATSDSDIFMRMGYMENMRMIFGRFNQHERELYVGREEGFKRGTSIATIVIGLLSILLGVFMGINARKQAKRFIYRFSEAVDEAKSNRDLLQTTLLSIGDAIIVTDREGHISLMNIRAEELTGWSQEEARNRSVNEIFHVINESDREEIENPIHASLRQERIIELSNHTLLLSRNGVEYPIDHSAAPIRNTRREVVGIVLVFRDVSSRKENEQESHQREREFRALIENAPDVIIRYDRELHITYVNPAIEHMLGISPQALVGRTFKEVGIPEEVFAPWEKAVRDVFLVQRSISTEIEYQTLHGIRRYQARLVPEVDENGMQSVISIARDITEIKITEDRLRESERRFRGVVENSPDAFFLLRALRNSRKELTDFVFEYLNGQGAELITVQRADCIGRKLTEALPGTRSEEFQRKYASVIETQVPMIEEYQVQGAYVSHARWLRSLYVPIGDNLAITTVDITERKRTENALRTSEERYRRLVENASEAIFSTDMEGRMIYANPYIRQLSGYTEEEIPSYMFGDLVVEEYRSKVKRHFYRQFLSHTPYSYIEAPFIAKEGQERWLAVTTSLRMNGEKIDGFDCIATDITDSKEMEFELREAKSKAEAGERAISDRVLQTATELALPLQSIVAMSRLLEQGKFPIDLQETASRIALNAKRALATIENMKKSAVD